MVSVSAPGKITLFGEHAIVYGEPAIAIAINKRIRVHATKRSDDAIRVEAKDLVLAGFKALLTPNGSITLEGESGKILAALSYVKRAIEIVRERYGINVGAHITITSEMPVGAGLGTSAAVAVSVIKAYSLLAELDLNNEECAELGYHVELSVQGRASRMDSTTTAIGGALYIDPRKGKGYWAIKGVERLKGLVVGYVNREASTGEMIERVKKLRDSVPEVLDLVIKTIGEISRKAKSMIEAGMVEELGTLMNINHGLLEAIGVSTSKLSQMVYAARSAGALGSKITGAGGGGCIIALAPRREEEVIAALKAVGAAAFKAELSNDGLKIEET
ncbi:MAG: mevalonate kinase [Candidatus Nezhaarchaeales archaeon]|nr:MAG: mevalonate kinase [Candidatus Nezhaarchaeota archaeon WYZ-LMO8]TDA37030.1 MAG: mevalonate kinase [Candidatus Nezhaarchaeota archaeon WYZ-LMO7]